ncbi:MAG: class I adenylate-forming enzyme family protein [Sulfitobacter sp.]
MNLAHWLLRAADRWPERPALFAGTDVVADYARFAREACSVAGWLVAQGIAPGDRVAIYSKNTPAYLPLLFGIWIAGGVAVPINAKLHSREVAFILEDAQAQLVCVAEPGRDGFGGAQARVVDVSPHRYTEIASFDPPLTPLVDRDGSDLAWLFYTSGTTGQPKGVMITHDMLMSMALCYEADVDRVTARDAALYAAPLSHGAGLYALMHVRRGARHVFPNSGGFDPAEIFDLAAQLDNVHMFGAPTMVKRLTDVAMASQQRGTGLRTVVYAGGPMYNADIIRAVDWFGPVFVQIYGQGECPMGITALDRADVSERDAEGWQRRLASVGRAQSAVDVQIGGPDGAALPIGQTGEIMVRGRTVMPGYWRNDAATAKALRAGWLMTGDMGHMDAAGYVTLTDRSNDVIITGGSNVYPREVEEVLLTHGDVAEVSVVGRPHPEWGEEVVAFVVGQATDAALDALCLDQIARFKRPKVYVRVAELPKNNYGKVLKTDLRARLK